MNETDNRSLHLGWIEVLLRAENPDLAELWLSGQLHYGSPYRLAFTDVYGSKAIVCGGVDFATGRATCSVALAIWSKSSPVATCTT